VRRSEPWVVRAYRRLVRLAPAGFRDLAGEDVGDDFAAMWWARRGRRRFTLVAVGFARLVGVLVVEWLEEVFLGRNLGTGRRERGEWEMADWFRTVRHALRSLMRAPAIPTTVVLLTGLGVGSVATVFTVADHLFLRALPYPDADRLVFVEGGAYSYPVVRRLAELAPRTVWAAASVEDATLTGQGDPLVVRQARVSPDFFGALGGHAAIGRLFDPGDFGANGPAVVSEATWERIWGRDPSLVGRTILVQGSPITVVGILGADFVSPARVSGRTVDFWRPVDLGSELASSHDYYVFEVAGRMARGSTLEGVGGEVDALARRLGDEDPDRYRNARGEYRRMPVVSLAEATVGDVRRSVGLLFGGASVLLLIACVNVAHLLLARGMGRVREFAVRRAMGAGGFLLTRQLLVESLLLGLGGGLVGTGFASLAVRVLRTTAPVDIPRLAEVSVDHRALGVALAVAALTTIAFGLLPSVGPLIGRPLAPTLRGGDRSSTSGPGTQGLRGVMVVAEVALSLVLVMQAGLLARSLRTLDRVDPGFRVEGLWRVPLLLGPSSGANDGVQRVEAIRDAVAAMAGVRGVSYGMTLPLEWTGGARCCQVVRVAASVGANPTTLTQQHAVGLDYFDVLDIPLLEGEAWSRADAASEPTRVVINEALARATFGDTDGIVGRALAIGSRPALVVGLTADVRHYGLDMEHGPALYLAPTFLEEVSLAVRADPGLDVARSIREAVWSVEPNLPVPTVESMDALVRRSISGPRFDSALIGAFSAVALLLAAGGLAGTLFFLVGERRREIGIRMTLGAAGGTVVTEVLRRGLVWAATGIVLGIGGGLAAARLIESRLFGVTAMDAPTVVLTSTLLLVVALGASWLPARSAARTDPLETLRAD